MSEPHEYSSRVIRPLWREVAQTLIDVEVQPPFMKERTQAIAVLSMDEIQSMRRLIRAWAPESYKSSPAVLEEASKIPAHVWTWIHNDR